MKERRNEERTEYGEEKSKNRKDGRTKGNK
jgi:hypothetical protein